MTTKKEPLFGFNDEHALFRAYEQSCKENAAAVDLRVSVSLQRTAEAYRAWHEDHERNHRNMSSNSTPDHLKAAAFLTYWLRRERPVIEVEDDEERATLARVSGIGMYSTIETAKIESEIIGREVTPEELGRLSNSAGISAEQYIAHRQRIMAYSNEYLAFDFGYRIARENSLLKRTEQGESDPQIVPPDTDFIDDLCYLLKFKNVSPHALFVIYRALLRPV